MLRPVRTVEEFYAHALAIEREAHARYAELHHWFRSHGHEGLATLCATLSAAEEGHLRELQSKCRGLELPAIDPAEYRWLDEGSPEAPPHSLLRAAARPRRVLQLALSAERNAAAFFHWVASTSPDPRVRSLAHELATEEEQHVQWVREALELHPR